MPNTPNPDVNSSVTNDNSDGDVDIERENDDNPGNENEEIPVPPDSRSNVPIEEPPDTQKAPIDENTNEPTRLV